MNPLGGNEYTQPIVASQGINSCDEFGTTRLARAVRENDSEAITNLCRQGALPDLAEKNGNGYSPATLAVQLQKYHLFAFLKQAGANLNHLDGLGQSPVTLAASRGDRKAITELHRLGVDFFAPNRFGESAASIIDKSGSREIKKLFQQLKIARIQPASTTTTQSSNSI